MRLHEHIPTSAFLSDTGIWISRGRSPTFCVSLTINIFQIARALCVAVAYSKLVYFVDANKGLLTGSILGARSAMTFLRHGHEVQRSVEATWQL